MSDARQILESIISEYSVEKFKRFFREKSQQFSPREETYSRYNDDNFIRGLKIGEINFSDIEGLLICAFEVTKALSERAGKKAQYEKAKGILKSTENQRYSAGIFIFYDRTGNFRFSLVYPESIGTRRQWNNFRRFTYFVSKEFTNKTYKQRIGEGNFSSLDNIKEAFSVEPVTNKFFEEFRTYFEKTKKEFENSNKYTVCLWLKDRYSDDEYNEQINKFTFTFLGRVIFIYFLQRKGWIENDGSYLKNIVENNNNSSLYLDFLQPLFFDVFAKKESERSPEIKSRYKDTPYLNGGLFEKSELEIQLEADGKFILVHDKFISDIILNFFENYNFTIDENSPEDQEISIDPEMLGKVFENTLAEEERGKKGTFYTPREIVHFMVKDSLFRFLLNETGLDRVNLHDFVYDDKTLDEIGFKKDEIRLIDNKLEHIKVLDPAVGSAAFPVEMMQILVHLRKQLNVNVGRNINEVVLKKRFIKENLYGVDIDPGAIEIAKLRLWLSLIVDYEKSEAEALPNLDFQFRLGNSLQEKIDGIDIFSEDGIGQIGLYQSESEYEKMKSKMIDIKDNFYSAETETIKRNLKKEFDDLEHSLIKAVLEKYHQEFKDQIRNQHLTNAEKRIKEAGDKIDNLKKKIKDGTYKLFKPDFHFSEVFDRIDANGDKIGGFDIVIGNPPYGVKIDEEIKDWHGLGSKDSYGVFMSTALKRFLKPGGVLSYIVSDTWLTIKTHKPLREQILENQLHKIVRVHQDCFDATVNACIVSLTKSPNNDGKLLAADLTNISTRDEIVDLREKLYNLDKFVGQSTPRFAVYEYDQNLINTNSNLPIFVGSPKLFTLMNDTTCPQIEKEIDGKPVKVRQIKFNDKIVELVRFGDIAEVKVGLQTGDNKSYLFQNPEARGSYRSITDYQKYLLTDSDIKRIVGNEDLRLKVVDKGFHKSRSEANYDEDLWFDGKYIVPYDKGGESDTESGWLPNYYVPTNYFIDWSREAVHRMKTLTSSRQGGSIASRFQNSEYYFRRGLSWSDAGFYSPTVRMSGQGVFDVKGSRVILGSLIPESGSALLTSKFLKYWIKNANNHTVSTQVDDFRELGIPFNLDKKLGEFVVLIVKKQKQNPRYNYMSNEQKEIDKLVYQMYGLNNDNIREVETWYARRYPKLARFCDI
ncbi:hypothetical protein A3A56_03840 [Candidatus Roizmanbacteria bacterium RIFCSPLOWO2_01_FULL_40_32]|nr:MAG: hypothetical protein A3A56_03840 [Candidatus Roizmanbacteria bacterium RIFCSPLOWO2_01_FULL_40_32]